jgi:Holliday junction resolvase RusA-like endonuclease
MVEVSTQHLTLDLYLPPSVNQIWRHGRGRVWRDPSYMDWIKRCDRLLTGVKLITIAGWFTVHIGLYGRASDGDNRIKALLDYLERINVVSDDKFCIGGTWSWVPEGQAPRGCRVAVHSWHGEVPE